MDSLTTAYLVCTLIGSAASVAGAFLGNKVFPIESSDIVQPPSDVPSVPESLPQTPEQPPAPSPQSTEQTQPVVPSAIV